jgi:hypothetical protein
MEVIQIFINGVYKFNWENYKDVPDGYRIIDGVMYKILSRHFYGDIFRIFITDKF